MHLENLLRESRWFNLLLVNQSKNVSPVGSPGLVYRPDLGFNVTPIQISILLFQMCVSAHLFW